MLFYQVYWQYLLPACFIVLQLRSGSCQIHGYVLLCRVTFAHAFRNVILRTAVQQLTRFHLRQCVARFLCDSCASCHSYCKLDADGGHLSVRLSVCRCICATKRPPSPTVVSYVAAPSERQPTYVARLDFATPKNRMPCIETHLLALLYSLRLCNRLNYWSIQLLGLGNLGISKNRAEPTRASTERYAIDLFLDVCKSLTTTRSARLLALLWSVVRRP